MTFPDGVLVSPEDQHLADLGPWRIAVFNRGKVREYRYVCFMRGGVMFLLHRHILKAGAGQVVDHVNGDTLNNLRSNLRLATQAENARNTRRRVDNKTGVKGVFFYRGRFHAQIVADGKVHCLGTHKTVEQAGMAYAEAALRLHGNFRNLG